MNMNKIKQGVSAVIVLIIFIAGGYVSKHVMNKWDIEGALEKQIKHFDVCKSVKSVDVPWWNPLEGRYDCTAKIERTDGSIIDVSFAAIEYSLSTWASDVNKLANTDKQLKNTSSMGEFANTMKTLTTIQVEDDAEIGEYLIKNLKVIKE